MSKEDLSLGDVVEIIENARKCYVGCFLVIDGLYDWGLSGFILRPFMAHDKASRVNTTLKYDEIYFVGKSFTSKSLI